LPLVPHVPRPSFTEQKNPGISKEIPGTTQ
jgi:hypothetical protein